MLTSLQNSVSQPDSCPLRYLFSQYQLDTEQYQLNQADKPVAVEPLVFELLTYLIRHRERVVSREELFENLWQGKVVSDAALSQTIKDARKAVGDSGNQQAVIKTLHGRGYQFIAEVSESDDGLTTAAMASVNDRELILPDNPSIAVLPFDNLSNDPEQEYFSDGIVEDIITALSHFSGLFVIARNSSFAYKGQSIDARVIARELGVRYLLEGSVRRSADRIRISGQLINALDGNHLWAEKFDGDLDDIFELQDEITRKIVGSIAPQIEIAEVERGRGLRPASLSSYELALKAKSLTYDAFRMGEAERLQLALETAKKALELDERNTHALWILGTAYTEQYLYQWGDDPVGALERATQVAEDLLLIDSSNAAGYIQRANCRIFNREFEMALTDYERGLSLNPNSSMHLIFAAWGESLAGETDLAKTHAELGMRLSPKEMDLFLGTAYLAMLQACFAEGDREQAMHWGRLAIQMQAKAPIRRALMVVCCADVGKIDEAQRHVDALADFSPGFIQSLLNGEMTLYKEAEHNALLVDGLRRSGLFD